MNKEKAIYVYADFLEHAQELIGTLYVSELKGREFYSFEYDESWVRHPGLFLDPDLQLYGGRQYLHDNKKIFGVFADSCPDRWGRKLMKRREEIRAKKAGEPPRKLQESDYLLGVYDKARMGGLRFKTSLDGEYVSDDIDYCAPPWDALRDLEQAAFAIENDADDHGNQWLRMLIAPGSSLGGARPKANVVAGDGSVWIAKFPSKHDEFDTGAWEMVVHELAVRCGINVPIARAEKFSKLGTTYLTKRFDRDGERRIHFSSAMTMLGKTDGADASDGSSYLEIASFLKAGGASPNDDIKELWMRIVFSIAVSNTDDHFRNHGFILTKEGWRLSPAYDINPDIYGRYLSLNIDSENAALDFDIAIKAAPYYGISQQEAKDRVSAIRSEVSSNWKRLAKQYEINHGEIDRMSPAFTK